MSSSTRLRSLLYHAEYRGELESSHYYTMYNVEQTSTAPNSVPCRMSIKPTAPYPVPCRMSCRSSQRPLLYHVDFRAGLDPLNSVPCRNWKKIRICPFLYHVECWPELDSAHFCTLYNIQHNSTAPNSVPCRMSSRTRQRPLLYHLYCRG